LASSGTEDLVPRGDEPQDDEAGDESEQDAALEPRDPVEELATPDGGCDPETEGHQDLPAIRVDHCPDEGCDGHDAEGEQAHALPGRLQEPIAEIGLPGQLVGQSADEADGDEEPCGSTDVHDLLLPGDGFDLTAGCTPRFGSSEWRIILIR
jgi:hypothetical protein